MKRIIIDTDPGVDDAQAIMMAVAHPDAQVEAITVVGGNVGLQHTVANACTILDVLGADIPVYAGCGRALVLDGEDAASIHGADGLGEAGFPPSSREVEKEHAAAALVRMANEAPGEISLIAIGPLTNLAVALQLDPDLPRKFKELVIMGGTISARGNTSYISAEFNIAADPEAAHIVFSRWPRLTMISWETTLAHYFPLDTRDKWIALGTPQSVFYEKITNRLITFVRQVLKRGTLVSADGLAMAVLLEPDIVQQAAQHHVSVELTGTYTRGQTTVDWQDRTGLPANVRVVLEADVSRFVELLGMGMGS